MNLQVFIAGSELQFGKAFDRYFRIESEDLRNIYKQSKVTRQEKVQVLEFKKQEWH